MVRTIEIGLILIFFGGCKSGSRPDPIVVPLCPGFTDPGTFELPGNTVWTHENAFAPSQERRYFSTLRLSDLDDNGTLDMLVGAAGAKDSEELMDEGGVYWVADPLAGGSLRSTHPILAPEDDVGAGARIVRMPTGLAIGSRLGSRDGRAYLLDDPTIDTLADATRVLETGGMIARCDLDGDGLSDLCVPDGAYRWPIESSERTWRWSTNGEAYLETSDAPGALVMSSTGQSDLRFVALEKPFPQGTYGDLSSDFGLAVPPPWDFGRPLPELHGIAAWGFYSAGLSGTTDGDCVQLPIALFQGSPLSAAAADTTILTIYRADQHQTKTAIGDFDGDGLQDLVVALRRFVSVYRGPLATGEISEEQAWVRMRVPLDASISDLDAGDLDGDGRDDLVLLLDHNPAVSIHILLADELEARQTPD